MDGGSGGDYFFSIVNNTTQPFGPVRKENLDVTLLIFDFTCWLNIGESIGMLTQPAVQLEGPVPVPPWQNDYPLDNTSVTQPPPDTYPLTVQSAAITLSATQVQVRVSAGTPGLNYVVSVIATSSEAQPRRKQVDCLVTVEQPLNPNMVSAATPDPSAGGQPLVINGTTTIPMGFNGRVYVQNTSGAPITVTLPITPTQLQRVAPVDIGANATQYPISFAGAPGDTIYGFSSITMDTSGDDVIFEWTGVQWIVLANHLSFLG